MKFLPDVKLFSYYKTTFFLGHYYLEYFWELMLEHRIFKFLKETIFVIYLPNFLDKV